MQSDFDSNKLMQIRRRQKFRGPLDRSQKEVRNLEKNIEIGISSKLHIPVHRTSASRVICEFLCSHGAVDICRNRPKKRDKCHPFGSHVGTYQKPT